VLLQIWTSQVMALSSDQSVFDTIYSVQRD
jgi:hypothetical protein